MLNIISTWLLSATLLFFTSRLVNGFEIPDFTMAFIASVFIGLVNVLIRPLINYLSLSLNLATVGVFSFAINLVVLKLAAGLMKSFEIQGWGPAILTSVLLTGIQLILFMIGTRSQKKVLTQF